MIYFDVLKYFPGSPCGSGESFVCHLDVVTRIAGIQVRFSTKMQLVFVMLDPSHSDQNVKNSIWTRLHQLKSEFEFPTKYLEDDVHCPNAARTRGPYHMRILLWLLPSWRKLLWTLSCCQAKARQVATRNMCKRGKTALSSAIFIFQLSVFQVSV